MATDTPHHNSDPGTQASKPPTTTTNSNIIHEGISTDRSRFTPHDVIADIWTGLGLPVAALTTVNLPGSDDAGPVLPSSYRIGCLAQRSIALSALSAALIHSLRGNDDSSTPDEEAVAVVPRVTVPLRHATASFRSVEHCGIISPSPTPSHPPASSPPPSPLLGLHPTASSGHIRIHSAFPHHRDRALRLLGLDPSSPTLTRAAVDEQTRRRDSHSLEAAGLAAGCAMGVPDFPVSVRRVGESDASSSPGGLPERMMMTGICAAVYRRAVEGGAYCVDVSLAGTGKYLRSLGQYEGRSGFECDGIPDEEVEGFLEVRESGLGLLKAVGHAASVEGCEVGWDHMPKPLGSDEAEWQS